jgi:c-di-AMP phosphodiesterase-like protein
MKQKAELFKPIIYALLAALAAVDVLCFFTDITLFYFVIALSVVTIGFCLVRLIFIQREIEAFILGMGERIGSMQRDSVIYLPMPVLVTDAAGEGVWYNDACRRQVFREIDHYGSSIHALLPQIQLPGLLREGSADIAIDTREYTVYGVEDPGDAGPMYTLYMIDNTELKRYYREYFYTRPSVMLIAIDSYEELQQSAKESERALLLSQIEYALQQYIGASEGVLCKVERDRFVALVEDRFMERMIERRFDLLDTVRALSSSERAPTTLSIGVSRQTRSYAEGELLARQALDMSLGRGGDQVSVRTKSGYEFFGGVSKGVEKRTKVKSRIVATALSELIESSEQIILMGHKFADLDAVGAAVGLYRIVRQMGKPAAIALHSERSLIGPLWDHLLQNGYEEAFKEPELLLPQVTENTLLIILDTHVKDVLESPELYSACRNVVVIDHHRRMVGYIDNAVIFYHEPYASSACEMVTELVQYFGERNRIGRIEAEALLAGIMLDTKNFVVKTGVRTFEAAAYLRRQGADTVEVRKFFASTMEAYRHRAQLVAAAELYRGCAIAATELSGGGVKVVAAQAADELLTISDVIASFVLYEFEGEVVTSARSMGALNVQLIMEKLGGGGHLTMAGAQLPGAVLADVKKALTAAIDELLDSRAAAH